MQHVDNASLALKDIPMPNDSMEAIAEFALTFRGYEVWGSLEKCAEVASNPRPNTLTECRTRLFFLQRAQRFQIGSEVLDADEESHWRGLVDKIRKLIESGHLD